MGHYESYGQGEENQDRIEQAVTSGCHQREQGRYSTESPQDISNGATRISELKAKEAVLPESPTSDEAERHQGNKSKLA